MMIVLQDWIVSFSTTTKMGCWVGWITGSCIGDGEGIHWPKIYEDLSVHILLLDTH